MGKTIKVPKYLRPFTKKWHMIRCPGCKLVARIDQDQYEGKVSIDCPNCEYHETVNIKAAREATE